eukprot:scaffold276964_cov28-Prasinocladus_malaysianus.AAC.1
MALNMTLPQRSLLYPTIWMRQRTRDRQTLQWRRWLERTDLALGEPVSSQPGKLSEQRADGLCRGALRHAGAHAEGLHGGCERLAAGLRGVEGRMLLPADLEEAIVEHTMKQLLLWCQRMERTSA